MIGRSAMMALLAALLAAACGYGIGSALRPKPADVTTPRMPDVTLTAADIPALPDLSQRPAAMREQLAARDAAARQTLDGQSAGALAMAYHGNGFYGLAQRCYALAIQLDGANVRWRYGHMLIDAELGRVDAVTRQLEAITALRPDMALAWYWLGEARFKSNDIAGAAEAYQQAIDHDKRSTMSAENDALRSERFALRYYASLGLARIAYEQQDYYEARRILVEVVSDQPNFGAAQRLLAQAYEGMTRSEEAARHAGIADKCEGYIPPADAFIDELARSSCDVTFLHKQVGLAITAGNNNWAVFLAQRAVEVDPDNAVAVGRLARLLYDLLRFADALPHLLHHHAQRSDDAQAAASLVRCLVDLDETDRAAALLADAMGKAPDDPHLLAAAGRLALHQKRYDKATDLFQRALTIEPSLRDTRAHLAQALLALRRTTEALEQYRLAVQQQDSAILRSQYGAALASAGDLRGATLQFRAAVDMQPDEPLLLENLSLALSQLGEHEQALRYAARIVDLVPDSARAHVFHAQRLAAAGRIDDAVAACRSAIELAPQMAGAQQLLQQLEAKQNAAP